MKYFLLAIFIFLLGVFAPSPAIAQTDEAIVNPGSFSTESNLLNGQLEAESNTVTTRVGTGNIQNTGGWPITVSSIVTQGLSGPTDHYDLYSHGFQSIDIANDTGTPIYTTFDGTVAVVCDDGQTSCGNCGKGSNENGCGYGKYVVVNSTVDGKNISVYFGHFSEIIVAQGQQVSKGTELGKMGTTGYSTGPHLHWEFRGIPMETPNIPQNITPLNCDEAPYVLCVPLMIPTGSEQPITSPSPDTYWFILHRQSKTEELFKGPYGNNSTSTLVKTFQVNPGRPGERPTPLPALSGQAYWIITGKQPNSNPETAPYFLALNVPYPAPYYGPAPYAECGPAGNEQCDWIVAGEFGLHGINGNSAKLTDSGSSGCIRHSDDDITFLYNLLDPTNQEIRYYIENN